MNPYWWVLLAAVVVEIAWAMSLKWIQMQPGVASISTSLVLTALNMLALSFAMRGIPVGTAYAVWTGLGAVGITLLGVIVFDDPLGAARLGFLALIIVGVVGLKLSTQGG
jgi:quaternary ammonium compound-resistance protein SugE